MDDAMQATYRREGAKPHPIDQTRIDAHKQQQDKYEHAIRQLEQHIHVKDGQLVLTIKHASELQLDPQVFDALRQSLNETNQLLQAGKITLDQVHLTLDAQPAPQRGFAVRGACAGRDLLLWFWWGTKTYVDECTTQELEGMLAVSAGAIAIAGALSIIGAVPSAVVAGFLGIEVGYMQFIDGLGGQQGVILNQPWIGPGWIWHQ